MIGLGVPISSMMPAAAMGGRSLLPKLIAGSVAHVFAWPFMKSPRERLVRVAFCLSASGPRCAETAHLVRGRIWPKNEPASRERCGCDYGSGSFSIGYGVIPA